MIEIDSNYLTGKLLDRKPESHKGDYGHLLLVCGNDNMPGAAVLATGAALKSGCGLVTLHSSWAVCCTASSRCPSAIFSVSDTFPDMSKYSAVAIGPGIGTASASMFHEFLRKCYERKIRMVLDADALTLLSKNPSWMRYISSDSVMTPHDGELARLCGQSREKLQNVRELAARSGCIVVSKGYHTLICTNDGQEFTNTTGNPGMAKGGSGDVLTGLIGGLMARGYDSLTASQLGVWIHGYAGDCLSKERTMEAYDSSDIIGMLHMGFRKLYKSL